MLTVTLRRAFSATLLAACLTTSLAACGGDQTSTGGPDRRPADDSAPSSAAETTASSTSAAGPIESRVVYFSAEARGTARPGVLHNRGELVRFAGKYAESDPKAAATILSAGGTTDFSRNVLVGWTRVTGCSKATAAILGVSGNRVTLQIDQPKPPPECFAPYSVTVVFEVPKERMPARPVLG
jgi:hypothetical protein